MGAEAGAVGTGVAGVLQAFVQHFELGGLQLLAQVFGHAVGQGGAHVEPPGGSSAPGSSFRWRATYRPWPMMKATGNT